jgi:hypothetical protein
MSITFSSCFYKIKSKFDSSTYFEWMNNFLSIVNNFNLVIYTDEDTFQYFPKIINPKIKVVIKPIYEFYNYKYKEEWINNHSKNSLLNNIVKWEINMLWSEKIWFVNETIQKQYFNTDFYGWCDIGYFRNRANDVHTNNLKNWCNNSIISQLDSNKIHYSIINNDDKFMNYLFQIVTNKNEVGLPIVKVPDHQQSVAGGFFILHKQLINWWSKTYETKLELYFKNNYLVKDDQIILIDCILSNLDKFNLYKENNPYFDNWFMFQRILS